MKIMDYNKNIENYNGFAVAAIASSGASGFLCFHSKAECIGLLPNYIDYGMYIGITSISNNNNDMDALYSQLRSYLKNARV